MLYSNANSHPLKVHVITMKHIAGIISTIFYSCKLFTRQWRRKLDINTDLPQNRFVLNENFLKSYI